MKVLLPRELPYTARLRSKFFLKFIILCFNFIYKSIKRIALVLFTSFVPLLPSAPHNMLQNNMKCRGSQVSSMLFETKNAFFYCVFKEPLS